MRSMPRSLAHHHTIPTMSVRARAQRSKNFDKLNAFVLDITNFSTIIYMLYEGGELKPPLGSLTTRIALPRSRAWVGGRATTRRATLSGERARRQPPIDIGSFAQAKP